ncbi:MAG: hypothetical protein JXQ73_23565 [Phycisphaerae bacterium]|nr:hypothetical protein [Phycisphaerae bacterium]
MTARPDYVVARREAGFDWHVGSSQGAIRTLADIPIREFNLDPHACIEAYQRGASIVREMFGEEVRPAGLATPGISYGHANGLGSELIFPEDGEVGHTHPYERLDDGIRALREPVDFAATGMAPYYLDFKKEMEKAFPGQTVGFGYGLEGPLTTAYEMRGESIFTDIFDAPDQTKEFLGLLTDSILAFHAFMCDVAGRQVVCPDVGGLCDDIASMIPPSMWHDLVLPYWEQYYQGVTTGRRHAHVEDLRPVQLPFLEEIGLAFFDPSISPKLNPRLITDGCRVPYTWRLGSIHYPIMSNQDIEDFVFQAVADGASRVHTIIAESMCNYIDVEKVQTFIRSAKEAERLLAGGATREEIGRRVSAEGKMKFWDRWWN